MNNLIRDELRFKKKKVNFRQQTFRFLGDTDKNKQTRTFKILSFTLKCFHWGNDYATQSLNNID